MLKGLILYAHTSKRCLGKILFGVGVVFFACSALAGGSIFGGGGGSHAKNKDGVNSIGVHICGNLNCPDVIIKQGDCGDIENAFMQYGVCTCMDGYKVQKDRCVLKEDKCKGKKLKDCQESCDPKTGTITNKPDNTACITDADEKGICDAGTCSEDKCADAVLDVCQVNCDPLTGKIEYKDEGADCVYSSEGKDKPGRCNSEHSCVPLTCGPLQFLEADGCHNCPTDSWSGGLAYGVKSCDQNGLVCIAGYYRSGDTCEECNRYSKYEWSEDGATSCNVCPVGQRPKYPADGTGCTNCDVGDDFCNCPSETPFGDGNGGCTSNACIGKSTDCYATCTTVTDEDGGLYAQMTFGTVVDFKTTCTLPGYSGKVGVCYDGDCYNECISYAIGVCQTCTPAGAKVNITNKANGTTCEDYDFDEESLTVMPYVGKCMNGKCVKK